MGLRAGRWEAEALKGDRIGMTGLEAVEEAAAVGDRPLLSFDQDVRRKLRDMLR